MNESGALEDLQVVTQGALRDSELAGELLVRPGALAEEGDDPRT
jgi:hypothetical protein